MATYHLSIKSGKKGKAAQHSAYIGRQKKFGQHGKSEDLLSSQSGNLPAWTGGDSSYFWEMADKHERANGAAYREYVIALPRELSLEQQEELVMEFIEKNLKGKTFQAAIHAPTAALGGDIQPHSHIMFSDRIDDGLERLPGQHFRRFNAAHPENGGCKKDSGGKDRLAMKAHALSVRKSWEQIQNAALERHGHAARVDSRSHQDRGITQAPERHLGPGRVRKLTEEERVALATSRRGQG